MRSLCLLILSILLCTKVMAQSIEPEFDVIDLGDILFEQPATATFKLKNRGSVFFLNEVKAFCGCTKVTYPRKTISKGENFSITVTYDAKTLGHFQKDIALISREFESPFYLTLKGRVIAQPQPLFGGKGCMIGKLHLSSNTIEFPDGYAGDVLQQQITFINKDNQPVNPLVIHVPSYMTAMVSPNVVGPNKQGTITFMLNCHNLPRYGLTQTSVYLAKYPGDTISKEKELTISAIKLPVQNFSESQLGRAPVLDLSEQEISLNHSLKGEIIVMNKGKSPLIISDLQSYVQGISITLEKTKLSPGESTLLKIKGTRKILKKVTSKARILLLTNDPNNQKVVINVNYEL